MASLAMKSNFVPRSLIVIVAGHQTPTAQKFSLPAHGPLFSYRSNVRQTGEQQFANALQNRKPLSWARVPSSMPGFLTSSRPSVSVVSPLISPSGSSRPPSTMSPSLVGPNPLRGAMSCIHACPASQDGQATAGPAHRLSAHGRTHANVRAIAQMPPVTVTSSRT